MTTDSVTFAIVIGRPIAKTDGEEEDGQWRPWRSLKLLTAIV